MTKGKKHFVIYTPQGIYLLKITVLKQMESEIKNKICNRFVCKWPCCLQIKNLEEEIWKRHCSSTSL